MDVDPLNKRGYVLLNIDRERVQGEFWHVATVGSRSREETLAAAFGYNPWALRLRRVPPRNPPNR